MQATPEATSPDDRSGHGDSPKEETPFRSSEDTNRSRESDPARTFQKPNSAPDDICIYISAYEPTADWVDHLESPARGRRPYPRDAYRFFSSFLETLCGRLRDRVCWVGWSDEVVGGEAIEDLSQDLLRRAGAGYVARRWMDRWPGLVGALICAVRYRATGLTIEA